VAPQEWYRTPGWDEGDRAHFEARLLRARPASRPQYLSLKAAALRGAGQTAGAVQLLTRVLAEHPDDGFHAAAAAEALAEIALQGGDAVTAEARYRESLRHSPDRSGTTGEVHLGLAEALLAQGRAQEAREAVESVPVEDLVLNASVCRWNAVVAETAHALGDPRLAAEAARNALALLDAPDQFSRHPGVGRAALPADRVRRLRRLAGAPSRLLWRR
jgi:predicted Zn-dependent protease